jgi:hypothetical protein
VWSQRPTTMARSWPSNIASIRWSACSSPRVRGYRDGCDARSLPARRSLANEGPSDRR